MRGEDADGDDLPYVLERPETVPEHLDEYPDEQSDDERLLRDVPPHY